jgi:holo-[acyl-carrier protein] synthase
MRIIGIGTDITECPRIGRMILEHGEQFLRRVYTEREIGYCNSRKLSTEHFAGRWAAKEAVLKAMGTGWIRGVSWTDIEILNESGGAPKVQLHGGTRDIANSRGVGEIMISISHCRTYATAYAIALMSDGLPAQKTNGIHDDLH